MKYAITVSVFLWILSVSALHGQKSISYVEGSTEKIEQLIGDWDRERNVPTRNRTFEKYQLPSTDLGVPFLHKGKTYLCFGDVWIENGDPLGFTTDTIAADGINLEFVTKPDGAYKKLEIPGVSMEGMEVPVEGVSWNGNMYLYCATDVMKKSVLAKSSDDGLTFTKLYDVSDSKFINLNLVKGVADENYPVPAGTEIQIIFGSGKYRESNVYLAFQRGDQIESKSIYYFKGLNHEGEPTWTSDESAALALFDQPCVGELSISYNRYIEQWILTYNCGNPRGINCRVADSPWGPWSEPFIVFDPAEGYCHFMHRNWELGNCDNVHDPGREKVWGGEYGPYQFDQLATGMKGETTIYYTMSTWNPYTVVLMKSTLKDLKLGSESAQNACSDLSIYPNPCTDRVTILFQNDGDGVMEFLLWSPTGRLVKQIHTFAHAGDNEVLINTEDLHPGIYYLQVKAPSFKLSGTTKLVKTNH